MDVGIGCGDGDTGQKGIGLQGVDVRSIKAVMYVQLSVLK